jgi:hypothetical protein
LKYFGILKEKEANNFIPTLLSRKKAGQAREGTRRLKRKEFFITNSAFGKMEDK